VIFLLEKEIKLVEMIGNWLGTLSADFFEERDWGLKS
jgi:hypothetical protein